MVNTYFYIENISDNVSIVSIIKNKSTAVTLNLEYSYNQVDWTEILVYSGITPNEIELPINSKLYLRGVNSKWGASNSVYNYIRCTENHNVGGNIMSLLYGSDFINQDTITQAYTFSYLFSGSYNLINSNDLQLPATTIKNNCYYYMFNGCSNLLTSPTILPAMKLAYNCYQYMFQNCSSLITVPELPATTLSRNCYTSMFNGCSSITTAPELPATELTNYCYQKMFANCTSLTTVPELPATTLATSCYQEMFLNCTSLKNLTIYYKGDNLANNAFDMLANVSQDGNFYMLADATFDTTDVVPINWIINKINTEPKMYFFIENISGAINTVSITKNNASAPTLNLEYSYNQSEWISVTMNEDTTPNNIEIPVDGKLYLRGVNDCWCKHSGQTISQYYNKITCSGNYNVGGNIMSLLYGSNFKDKITFPINQQFYGFSSLFKSSITLVNAQDLQLPATTLVQHCYNSMFDGCTSLTTVPSILPATTLTNYCYSYMFRNCTSLTTTPELAATTLSYGCYSYMFYGTNVLPDCSNIDFTSETVVKSGGLQGLFAGTKVTDEDLLNILPINPETNHYYLPVMNLASSCYNNMFYSCTSLTTAPELPATTLPSQCYNQMFYGCTSLTTAPELPATTLSYGCYSYMFAYCKSLTTALSILPATTLANDCYNSMFYGCTSLTTAPELPATTLATKCYLQMFNGCTSLTTAPELPAIMLVDYCYQSMFAGCTSLTTAPELPATTLADYCYYQMFAGCKSLTTAPELPASTLATSCYYQMFRNCTSLTTAPELPATTLASNCYQLMFQECRKLNYIKADFIDYNNDNNEFTNWVNGVSSTGTFVMNPEATYNPEEIRGYNGIPTGWNAKRAGIDTLMIKNVDNLNRINKLELINYSGDNYTLSYSLDYRDWFDIEFTYNEELNISIFTIEYSNIVYLRGVNKSCNGLHIDCKYDYIISSNIMALLQGEDIDSYIEFPESSKNNFKGLFKDSETLVDCSGILLPVEELTDGCYSFMFMGCKQIENTPELPAMTLSKKCYEHMFSDCESLTEVCELPALYIPKGSYHGMFFNCINLENAPELPAENLSRNSYSNLFKNCKKLINTPKLPAIDLYENTYRGLFQNCNNVDVNNIQADFINVKPSSLINWVDKSKF